MNPVPTNVTVIASPVQGFTSGNTSRTGNSSGASAAAEAANARATTLSRATTSLMPPQRTPEPTRVSAPHARPLHVMGFIAPPFEVAAEPGTLPAMEVPHEPTA